MRARFSGHCARCGNFFPAGSDIRWNPKQRGKARHAICPSTALIGTFPDPPVPEPWSLPEPYTPHTSPKPLTVAPEPLKEIEPDMSQSILNIDALAELLKGKIKADSPAIDADAIRQMVAEECAKFTTVTVTVTRPNAPDVTVENAHAQFEKLLKIVNLRRHVYLHGPAGSGKSTLARMVAEALGLPFGYISLNPMTPDSRLQGFIDANGIYRDPQFRKIYEHGGVFCIDECDNASGALLTTLNTALENGHGAFPDGEVKRHPDFVMIATGNTAGRGANPAYPERRPFDAAFGDRFVYLPVGYDEKLERKVALTYNANAGEWVSWVQRVRKYALANSPRLLVSPRSSFVGADLLGAGFSVEDTAHAVLFKGIDTDTIAKVIASNPYPEIGA